MRAKDAPHYQEAITRNHSCQTSKGWSSAMQVDSSQGATAAQAPVHHMNFDGPRGQQILKALADKLGTTPDDLKAQLDSGKSLKDRAAAKGLTPKDRFAAVRQALGGTVEANGTQGVQGHQHHHHH